MDGLTEAERATVMDALWRDFDPREDDPIFPAIEAILRDRLADLQESNVALLQRVADLTAERDEARRGEEVWVANYDREQKWRYEAERALAARDEVIARLRERIGGAE